MQIETFGAEKGTRLRWPGEGQTPGHGGVWELMMRELFAPNLEPFVEHVNK